MLVAQLIGSAIVTSAHLRRRHGRDVCGATPSGLLRVSEEGELYGLDLHEHGISAYPEYVISALGAPAGTRQLQPETDPVADRVLTTAPHAALHKAVS